MLGPCLIQGIPYAILAGCFHGLGCVEVVWLIEQRSNRTEAQRMTENASSQHALHHVCICATLLPDRPA